MSALRHKLAEKLEAEEGRKACAYNDHLGYRTIGVGFLVDPRVQGAGLRPEEIDFILQNRITLTIQDLDAALPWAQALDEARYGALILMAYQMGISKLLGFRNSLRFIREGYYRDARRNLLRSLWAKQTPARAQRVARQIETGEWQ